MNTVLDSPATVHPDPIPETLRVLQMPDGTYSVESRKGSTRGVVVREITGGMWGCGCSTQSPRSGCIHIASVRDLLVQRHNSNQAPMAHKSGAGIGFSGPRWSEGDEVDERVDPADLFGLRRTGHGR